jgi:hypothetical protein
MRGTKTARELAEQFNISEPSVWRIWKETSLEDIEKDLRGGMQQVNTNLTTTGHHHALAPEVVQMMTVKQYFHLIEEREYYRAKADAEPYNCAWSNVVLRYDHEINDLLKVMGNWYGLERTREPMTSTKVRNADLRDYDLSDTIKLLNDRGN